MDASLRPTFALRLLALGCFSAFALASPAGAWWNGQWTARKQILLDTSAAGAAIDDAVGTVPVLLRLSDGNFRFSAAKPDGSDLRFVADDDKTPLAYHIEKFDTLLDEALVWVRVPDVKPSAKTSFWLYYGNAGANVIKADDPKGTYDDSTVIVHHFSEHGQAPYDFSGHGNTAQGPGLPDDGAIIGTGLRLDGKSSVTLAADPAWTEGAALTWSAWFKFSAPQPDAVLFSRQAPGWPFLIGVNNGAPFVQITDSAGTQRSSAGPALPAGGWHHLAVVASGSTITVYVDGASYGLLNQGLPALNSAPVIGGDNFGSPGFIGSLDELEVSKTARSAGFIKFEAVSQGPDASKLISFGADEAQTSWLSALKTGYIGIIMGSLTPDGWAVIGILGVMSIVSWLVMINKARYLNSIAKGNAQFLAHWREVAGDLSVIDTADGDDARTMGGRLSQSRGRRRPPAPLYRIYHLGIEEIQMRLSAEDSKRALSARSIQAIRAVLDGGLIRETQKLNNQMVLLTIAISGGPFLGLLGTVIGVMITFAAVAAAGDVNVNAIAPGIAAALAATVAGLAVAIPALFGYNYLLTRIKGYSSDMHVFIDEFVTRLAEFYSEPVA